MPLQLEKTPVVPNAIFAPQILLQTRIVDGQILTSAQIILQTAKVEQDGKWSQSAGQSATLYIPDIMNLEPDIASQSKTVAQLFETIVGLIGNLNAIRKVL